MYLLYDIVTEIVTFILKPISFFNTKIALGVNGRKNTFKKIEAAIKPTDKTMWFHCSSLGEYEQGLPVFKEAKKIFPNHKVILTFFSPSGYEIRKNAEIADVVAYLPFDKKRYAKRFIKAVHPSLTIYVKYEIWPNMLNTLKKTNSHSILISALFRTDQSLFKWYSTPGKLALYTFDHIFTQNESSKKILKDILNYTNVTSAGDTRFDRVSNQLKIDNTLNFIADFKDDKLCVVIGSSWTEDETLFINYINNAPTNVKFIIAPHNVHVQQIKQLQNSITKQIVLFSEKDNKTLSNYNVFIIDTIGILSKIYNYADIAYIGGGMGTNGLHNTLEAAIFGVPIIIGKNYSHFPEASQMIAQGSMFSVSNEDDFKKRLDYLIENSEVRHQLGQANASYIEKNQGAVSIIANHIERIKP